MNRPHIDSGQELSNQEGSPKLASWLNCTTLGIGLTSFFSDWSHEIATAILPAFLASLGAGPGWLGAIEGTADGLSSFSKLAAGHYIDRLKNQCIARFDCPHRRLVGPWCAHSRPESFVGSWSLAGRVRACLRL